MTIYAFIEDNEIKEIHYALPMNWRNVSGFNLIGDDPETLLTFGWYIVIDDVPDYDSTIYTLNTPTFSFDGEKVTSNYTLNTIQKEDPLITQQMFLRQIRLERDGKLFESDWTMAADILKMKNDTWFTEWQTYRQQLRDFPASFTFGPTEFPPATNSVSWPTPPQ